MPARSAITKTATGSFSAKNGTNTISHAIANARKLNARGNEGVRYPEGDLRVAVMETDLSLPHKSGAFAIPAEGIHQRRFFRAGVVGARDIVCIVAGQYVGIEVKAPKGRQGENQKEF
jgi:hypothetical protein